MAKPLNIMDRERFERINSLKITHHNDAVRISAEDFEKSFLRVCGHKDALFTALKKVEEPK